MKVVIELTKTLVGSRFSVIPDDIEVAWDEHKEFMSFHQSNIRWQRYIACSVSFLKRFIDGLEVCLERPLLKYLHELIDNMRTKINILILIFFTHKLYTKMIIVELSSFINLITYHTPPLFHKEENDSEGKEEVKPKVEWKVEIKTLLNAMIVDIKGGLDLIFRSIIIML